MNSVVRETPARRQLPLPEGTISYLEWGYDEPGKTPLHFAHANGFNAMTYRRVLAPLADQFHVRAWDARGHGATTLTADPGNHRNWYVYRDDLIAMAEDFVKATGRKIILAGHSMGGAASVMAAAARPDLVRGLVLVDPVMIPSGARHVMLLSQLFGLKGNPLADGAEKRRAVFPDRETMVERYAGRGAFRTWPREFVEDYVQGGTKIRDDGQAELLCAPAWEAANFRAQGHNITKSVRNLHVPFAMLYAEHGSTCRPPFPMLLKRRDPKAQVTQIRGATHFLPMEFPKLVADEIRAFRDRLEAEGR
ncbi:alpha/beta hydrolase [Parvibaculum sp.]|jgi:pimeloyl-ACP methyl ester carboxylesterase|uniref:alpha/beta fold hydrolase n=1 Tax=Parvibaculum sp. TaxID=2024848 RepID=UPI001B26591C|nr:alpha/beta hydrolase [Parvibaculum sp.]MBO6666751.1 alpha/beta hydrolase [Parvibaculum sp.]MBO6693683.1 alpha/beta hydrolase [Parvibaculum sp.]MBO6713372.1 alpha/beta hydrolase [Parvibaculum sp.]